MKAKSTSEDPTFIEFVRISLSRLVGKQIELVVRKNGRAQPCYKGKILSVGKNSLVFDAEYARVDRPAGRFTYQLSDVHSWVVGDDVITPLKPKTRRR